NGIDTAIVLPRGVDEGIDSLRCADIADYRDAGASLRHGRHGRSINITSHDLPAILAKAFAYTGPNTSSGSGHDCGPAHHLSRSHRLSLYCQVTGAIAPIQANQLSLARKGVGHGGELSTRGKIGGRSCR